MKDYPGRKLILLALLLSLGASALRAQPAPQLAGTIEIDLPNGGIRGDVCLTELPAQADTVRFVLHRGLNVKRIRDAAGALSYAVAPEPTGVGLRYAVRHTPDSLVVGAPEHRPLCVEYTGSFPIYRVEAGDYALSDGSGMVAFNGQTVRARGETRWYPVPYDPRTDQAQESLSFRLHVLCPACERLYLNGAAPQRGPEGEFASEVPREIVLLAGDFPVQDVDGMVLLGEQVTADTARLFVERITEIQRFYEAFLGVPYGDGVDFARIVPVRFDRPFQMWGFFSDPLLGVTGMRIADFVQILDDPEHPARPALLGFLAHELAHRYFSGPLRGPYDQLFSEPFADYLAAKATRHFHGDEAYQEGLRLLHQQVMEGPDLPPLDRADPRTLASDPYRYRYAPLLLFTLESRIGEEQLRRVLNALLTAPPGDQAQADYAFLRQTALRAGVDASAWGRWEAECMRPSLSSNTCLRDILRRPAPPPSWSR